MHPVKLPFFDNHACKFSIKLLVFGLRLRDAMPEDQNIEWKESWRDEYLKWICGFANAQGGRIYIGVNDDGCVTGVTDYRKLLEDIPNKVQTTLGIMVDVNLLREEDLYYIEINISPSSFAVNYRGEYYYRSGSTRQQLKGAALTDFLLKKTGYSIRWDAEPAPQFSAEELDYESFDLFRKAAKSSGRVTDADLKVGNIELLNRLGLLTPDGYLKKAAVLLFYRQPELLISGCYIKLGMFGEGADLQYQEEIRGSLIIMAERLMEIIFLKYLKADITYEGKIRVERYPYPREALREIIYNALIHCDWRAGEPVYVKVTKDSLSISNVCQLPLGWTQSTLMSSHKSKPHNPDIANTFFRAGYVEIWGRGIEKVRETCRQYGLEEPSFEILGEDLTVTFYSRKKESDSLHKVSQADIKKTNSLKDYIIAEIRANPQVTLAAIATNASVSKRSVQYAINKLVDSKIIKREGTARSGRWIIL